MRIAVVAPDVPRYPKYEWVMGAFLRLNHECRMVRDIEGLKKADSVCDLVVFSHKSAGLNATDLVALSNSRKAQWVQWWFDLVATESGLPLASQPWIKSCAETLRSMDHVFVRESGMIEEYKSLGINANWLDQACPYWMARTQTAGPKQFDFAVFGQASKVYRDRCEDVRELAANGYSVVWYGNAGMGVPQIEGVTFKPWVAVEKMAAAMSEAKVFLAVDWADDIEGYWSDRVWLGMGMGACVLRRSQLKDSPGISYRNRPELLELARRLCDNVAERTKWGDEAYRLVREHHTYESRCESLLEICGEQKPSSGMSAKHG